MVEIKKISYEDERLGFFVDQRKLAQKRYDRLKRQIKSDEPYTSERMQFLYDCARELSFYNDVVGMLEDNIVPSSKVEELEVYIEDLNDSKEHLAVMLSEAESEIERLQSECDRLKKDNEYILMQHAFQRRPSGDCWNDVIEKRKSEAVQEVLEKLDKFINSQCIEIKDERGIKGYVTSGVHYAIDEFKRKYRTK
ncbi:MAG: hypothetical protein J6R59_10355 [Paludibacteraceae bacterium]|nr:hypothetical protein [Paludibacteraceae bacterium]